MSQDDNGDHRTPTHSDQENQGLDDVIAMSGDNLGDDVIESVPENSTSIPIKDLRPESKGWFDWVRMDLSMTSFAPSTPQQTENSERDLLLEQTSQKEDENQSEAPNQSSISPQSIQMLEDAEEAVFLQKRKRQLYFLGVGTIIFLFWFTIWMVFPREALFTIESFAIDPDNSTFKDGDQIYTNWVGKVQVYNPNVYPLSIKSMDLTMYLKTNSSSSVGNGSATNLYFPLMSTVKSTINFQMPVYSPSTGKPSLIAECMRKDNVDLLVEAILSVKPLHLLGKTIKRELPINVKCMIPAFD